MSSCSGRLQACRKAHGHDFLIELAESTGEISDYLTMR